MLPGFRFLFAAILLSVSVLIFGLGAAALLRAAHEQFASVPQRLAPPEPVFARRDEPLPTLALLRVEPEIAEKVPDNVTGTAIQEIVMPTAAAPEAPTAEPDKLAAVTMDEVKPAEPAKPEDPAAEAPPAVQVTPAEAPDTNEEVKLAAVTEPPPPVTAPASTPAEAVAQAPPPEGNPAASKIATLGGPVVTIEKPAAAKKERAKPKDRSVSRKRTQRAKERRRVAAARRAQLARQIAAQQAADPFAPTPVRGR